MAQLLETGFFVKGDLTTANDLIEVIGRFAGGTTFGCSFGMGTGSGNVDIGFSDQRVLTTGATENIDLNGSANVNIFGAAMAMTKLKGLFVWAPSTNTTTLTIGNVTNGIVGPVTAATMSFDVKPGGFAAFADPLTGFTVTAATGDLIKVLNGSGASATYNILVLGASS